jgi:carbon-monoxide dehydrogenase medium subunit
MFPPKFDYFKADSLAHAVELMARYGKDGRILAGGQSLLPLMKLRLATPAVLIDINRVKELGDIRPQADGRSIGIGSLVRHYRLERTPWPASLACICDAAKVIGDAQIRNMGTLGGSLAEADPSGDWGPVMLVLGASVKSVSSSKGERVVPIDEFFLDAFTSALNEDELLTEVDIPVDAERTGTAYLKMERKAGDFPIASAGIKLSMNAAGYCEGIRVALGGVGLTPLRARRAEEILKHKALEPQLIMEAQRLVESDCEPFADIRGTVEFKRHLAGVLFGRALQMAAVRARGEEVETVHV